MFTKRICASALLVAAVACASGTASTASTSSTQPARNPDVISAAELADPTLAAGTVLEAIRRLRPRFLNRRGTTSIQDTAAGAIHVSIDGGPLLAIDQLGRMRPADVAEIRFLSPPEASQRFGMAAGTGGVIMLKTK